LVNSQMKSLFSEKNWTFDNQLNFCEKCLWLVLKFRELIFKEWMNLIFQNFDALVKFFNEEFFQ
jgi:hypothetical protein